METTGEVTQGLEGPSQILLHNRAVSFLSKKKKKKKTVQKFLEAGQKQQILFLFLSFFFLEAFPCYPGPQRQCGHFLSFPLLPFLSCLPPPPNLPLTLS